LVASSNGQVVGRIVAGGSEGIELREKDGANLELGDLVVVEDAKNRRRHLYMVSALEYKSLVADAMICTGAGSMLERTSPSIEFPKGDLSLFKVVRASPLLEVVGDGKPAAKSPRSIPPFLSEARNVVDGDFAFLGEPKTKVLLGRIRSGSKTLDFRYCMDGDKMLSHHVLVSAQTGRGKSNLMKVMIWEAMGHRKFGIFVLDVHNEYYGVAQKGLKDHPDAGRALVYYSKKPPPGQKRLRVNLKSIRPTDVLGILYLSEAQEEAIGHFYRKEGRDWIKTLMTADEEEVDRQGIKSGTLRALRRKFGNLFNLRVNDDGTLSCADEVFDTETMGESTIGDMADALEGGKVVLVDGSSIPDDAGLIVTSAVLHEVFRRYEDYKTRGILDSMPLAGVVLEEAPRVLSEKYGSNIFGRIAREGRKFRIGLIAVTQMASEIPKEILANIGTKVIMGNELALERKALIESAAQDLTPYDRIIAGLDEGEAIVSSIFSRFPVPIYVPLFEDIAKVNNVEGSSPVFF